MRLEDPVFIYLAMSMFVVVEHRILSALQLEILSDASAVAC